MSESSKGKPTHSPRQVLLGLFILFQLTFLIVNNLLDFVKWAPSEMKDESKRLVNRMAPGFADEQGHAWHWAEQVETNIRRWVQLTGQDQAWSLFAPSVSTSTGFPAVVLIWEDVALDDSPLPGTFVTFDVKNGFNICGLWDRPGETPSLHVHGQLGLLGGSDPWQILAFAAAQQERTTLANPPPRLVLSSNEPFDIHRYVRTGDCRVRRYDGQFYFNPQPYLEPQETTEALADRLSRRTKRLLTDYHDPAVEYLRWRLRAWQSENPNQPVPKQLLLVQRFYRIHGPEEGRGWDGPYTVPIARLQTQPREIGLTNRLEPFDFTLHRFVRP